MEPPAGAWSIGPGQGLAIAGLALAVVAFATVRTLRPRDPSATLARGFGRLARAAGLSADERATVRAMGAASSIEPAALLLSDRALRMARVKALASGDANGALSSGRVKAACARLGVD